MFDNLSGDSFRSIDGNEITIAKIYALHQLDKLAQTEIRRGLLGRISKIEDIIVQASRIVCWYYYTIGLADGTVIT